MAECFWCDAVYDLKEFSKCPDCQSDINTKEIQIIKETDEYRRLVGEETSTATASGTVQQA